MVVAPTDLPDTLRLSLLDRSRTRVGESHAAAIEGTLARAERADALGFHRYWTAEHHAVPGIASGSPPLLIAAAAARTDRIRLGSGGVMLPNHRPLIVAEQFAMLEAMHPGRIDLGVGRSLGFTAPVREALGVAESAAHDARTARRHTLLFAAGVLVSMWALVAVLFIREVPLRTTIERADEMVREPQPVAAG